MTQHKTQQETNHKKTQHNTEYNKIQSTEHKIQNTKHNKTWQDKNHNTQQETNDKREEGKKFERKKVRIAEKVELFSSRSFFLHFFLLVHMEVEVLQQWQTTHFKASKWWRMKW